jgi:hypothetical protein
VCNFISWIKYQGKIYFLNTEQMNSQRLMDWNQSKDDLTGHGAIRFMYDIPQHEGEDCECQDFSNPANFPIVIVSAIKRGELTSFDAVPKGILKPSLYADYEAKRNALYADYWAKRNALHADYWAKRNALYADYEAKLKPSLDADYWAKCNALDADYWAECKPLDADYWAKVKIQENRSKEWK